jgi:rod shape-determining protein MreB
VGPTTYVRGRDVIRGVPSEIQLSRSQVVDAVAEPLSQIVEVVRSALEHTQPEIAADVIDQGITMTGGGSLLRNIDTLIHEATGLPVHIHAEIWLTSSIQVAGGIHPDILNFSGSLKSTF